MWWDYWPAPWMFFGPIMMLIFIAVCVTVMVFMMRGRRMCSRGGSALDILKERFARGEITESEYKERRRLLEA